MIWQRLSWLRTLRKLPCNAATIYAEWPIKEGGVCAYAWTDKNGTAFLAVKSLNCIGKPTGIPDWQRRRRFLSDMVVGFINRKPLVISLRVKVTVDGLELIVRMPRDIKSARDFCERRFSAWGSGSPPLSFTLVPTFDPYAVNSFPIEQL